MIFIELALLTGLTTESKDSYDELNELIKTSDAKVVDVVIQNKKVPDTAYFIGRGKAFEIKEKCEKFKINTVIFNVNLKPSQQRNLEEITKRKIIDRCTLILNIFAKHARSNEGKLQVELAQLTYLLPRLSGAGTQLSQMTGGIGTMGPGEKKLEVDRRRIRARISFIKRKIEEIRKHRDILRESRKKKGFLTATIVGYTNSGKSTLLNTLTKSNVLTENKLFSTLDPTTRKLVLPNKKELLLTDTVGFIRNLPAEIITAFRATLEEINFTDIIIVVLDISRDDINLQNETIFKELNKLNVSDKPVITVVNKIDLTNNIKIKRIRDIIPDSIYISALKMINTNELLCKISLVHKELLTKT